MEASYKAKEVLDEQYVNKDSVCKIVIKSGGNNNATRTTHTCVLIS